MANIMLDMHITPFDVIGAAPLFYGYFTSKGFIKCSYTGFYFEARANLMIFILRVDMLFRVAYGHVIEATWFSYIQAK